MRNTTKVCKHQSQRTANFCRSRIPDETLLNSFEMAYNCLWPSGVPLTAPKVELGLPFVAGQLPKGLGSIFQTPYCSRNGHKFMCYFEKLNDLFSWVPDSGNISVVKCLLLFVIRRQRTRCKYSKASPVAVFGLLSRQDSFPPSTNMVVAHEVSANNVTQGPTPPPSLAESRCDHFSPTMLPRVVPQTSFAHRSTAKQCAKSSIDANVAFPWRRLKLYLKAIGDIQLVFVTHSWKIPRHELGIEGIITWKQKRKYVKQNIHSSHTMPK